MPDTFTGQRVEAIPGAPLPHGLLSVSTVLDAGPGELMGVQWRPLSCAEAGTTDWCVDPDPPEKVFGGSEVATALPVSVYYGYDCNPIGETMDEARAQARAGLSIGEPRAIEAWFMSEVLAANAPDITPTPGTAVSVVEGVGILEAALATTYGGIGVVHATAGTSSRMGAESQLVKDGARYQTWLGNRVALGAGYEIANIGPGDTPPGAGEAWMYISGPVVVRRDAPALLPDGEDQTINVTLNDRLLLAERTWVLSYECATFAVLVESADMSALTVS